MFTVIAVIHVLLCLMLMGLVLLQQGKGADAGAVLGGGGDSLLAVGGAGAAVTKMTTGLAIAFMVTSIVLVKLYDQAVTAPVVVDDASLLKGSIMEAETAEVTQAVETETESTAKVVEADSVGTEAKAPDNTQNEAAPEQAQEAQTEDAEQPTENSVQ